MNALERFRIHSKLSFQALAVLLGVDRGRAFQWCKGTRTLPAERVVSIEAATGVPRAELRPDLYVPAPVKAVEAVA